MNGPESVISIPICSKKWRFYYFSGTSRIGDNYSPPLHNHSFLISNGDIEWHFAAGKACKGTWSVSHERTFSKQCVCVCVRVCVCVIILRLWEDYFFFLVPKHNSIFQLWSYTCLKYINKDHENCCHISAE